MGLVVAGIVVVLLFLWNLMCCFKRLLQVAFVTGFAKRGNCTHTISSLTFYCQLIDNNNRLTVHACTIAKGSMVYTFTEASFTGLCGVHGGSGGL